ncbi:MAG: glutathione S-transferase family protein [Pseudomonadales bacterium]|nr:glutathione S-transferase family protein [Pseudomonadales bacterium]
MLKLHGYAVSNYYNMVKHALFVKGIEYEAVTALPDQGPEMLAKSPMGKVPFIETEQGILTETNIILEYLDEVYPDTPLYPSDPFEKAKVKEVLKTVELYIEAPAHTLVPELMGREKVAEETKKTADAMLSRGIAAFQHHASFSPYACGENLTAADILIYYSIKLAKAAGKVVLKRDIVTEVEGLAELMSLIDATDVAQQVVAENKAALKAM